jgi:monovalent cation:H+ antiporter-2, CPA2 family
MAHLPELITDLALILGAAAITTLIFKWLRQPLVLGYIIAGLLVGPHVGIFPTVADDASITTWAEIGVIFLLFSLGLEFSFRKLVKVGTVAGITALAGVGMTIFLGYNVGRLLGWESMDCLFLGGILGIASTTIIIRAFDELGVKSQKFAGIVMGVLVVEDLVAVLLMVILSTVSVSSTVEGGALIEAVLKLGFFLILWFVSGIFFLPTFFRKAKKLMNDETLLIVSIALCLLMVILATNAGFSAALGAFIMGSLLAETPKVEKIEHLMQSVKNLFGAIFFVSVGMLIEPKMLVEHAVPVILASLVLLIGKPLFVTIGALLAGQPLRIAVQSGMSLSQIGEFSFIIATLGVTLKVTSDFLYPVAVAVSVVTTFTTPYMIRFSGTAYKGIEKVLPGKWKRTLTEYSVGAQNVSEAGAWKRLMQFYLMNIAVFSVIITTIIILSTQYLTPIFDANNWNRIIEIVIVLTILAPFLWALAFRRASPEAYASIWKKPLQRGPLLVLMLSRVALAIFFVGFLFDRIFSPLAAVFGVLFTVLALVVLRNRIKAFYGKIETRFLDNLNTGKTEEAVIAPWDTHLAEFTIHAWSPLVGRTLLELQLREIFGINIAVITRGDLIMNVPVREERLYPNDVLSVIGTDEQLKAFRDYLEVPEDQRPKSRTKLNVSLHHFHLPDDSQLVGQTIRSSGIRERTKGLVVGVERNGERILNPNSDLAFEAGDLVWLVGSDRRIQTLLREPRARQPKNK